MTTATLLVQIRSLEAQLAVLRARLEQGNHEPQSFADLYGILAGVESTEQDIEAAELQAKVEPN